MKDFHFEVNKVSVNASYNNSDKGTENIRLVVQVDEDTQLDIDKNYLFANNKIFSRHANGRKQVEGIISIQKESNIDSRNIKKDAIGYAIFFDENIGEIYIPPRLYFQVFFDDELYNKIYSNFSSRLFITQVSLKAKAETEGELKFGPDIDGRHVIWKRTNDNSRLHLDNFGISFDQTEKSDGDTAEEKENRKNMMLKNFFKELDIMLICLIVIAVAAVVDMVAKLFQ